MREAPVDAVDSAYRGKQDDEVDQHREGEDLDRPKASFRFFESFAVAAVVYVVLYQAVNFARVLAGRYLFRAEQRA